MHEPIISRETFDYVQDLFRRITLCTHQGTVRPLSSFVRCGDCGMVMSYRGSTEIAYQYMNCSSYLRKEGCGPHSVSVTRLHGVVLGEMRTLIEKLAGAREVLKFLKNGSYRQATIDAIDAKIEGELAEEKWIMGLKTMIYEQKVIGVLGEDEYIQANQNFTDELKATEDRIKELQEEKGRICTEQTNLLPWIDSLMEFRGMEELSRKAVVTMIDYVYVYTDGVIDVHFRYAEETKDLLRTAQERQERRRNVG